MGKADESLRLLPSDGMSNVRSEQSHTGNFVLLTSSGFREFFSPVEYPQSRLTWLGYPPQITHGPKHPRKKKRGISVGAVGERARGCTLSAVSLTHVAVALLVQPGLDDGVGDPKHHRLVEAVGPRPVPPSQFVPVVEAASVRTNRWNHREVNCNWAGSETEPETGRLRNPQW